MGLWNFKVGGDTFEFELLGEGLSTKVPSHQGGVHFDSSTWWRGRGGIERHLYCFVLLFFQKLRFFWFLFLFEFISLSNFDFFLFTKNLLGRIVLFSWKYFDFREGGVSFLLGVFGVSRGRRADTNRRTFARLWKNFERDHIWRRCNVSWMSAHACLKMGMWTEKKTSTRFLIATCEINPRNCLCRTITPDYVLHEDNVSVTPKLFSTLQADRMRLHIVFLDRALPLLAPSGHSSDSWIVAPHSRRAPPNLCQLGFMALSFVIHTRYKLLNTHFLFTKQCHCWEHGWTIDSRLKNTRTSTSEKWWWQPNKFLEDVNMIAGSCTSSQREIHRSYIEWSFSTLSVVQATLLVNKNKVV